MLGRIPVDGVDCEDSIASHVRVTMFETSTYCRHQRLYQLRLLQLAQKPQSRATDEFVWMLQVLLLHHRHHPKV